MDWPPEHPVAHPIGFNGTMLESAASSMAGSSSSSSGGSADAAPFPEEFAALQRLRVLNLNCCDLERVPPAVVELTGLQELHFCGNRARSESHAFFCLPKHISNLQVRCTGLL